MYDVVVAPPAKGEVRRDDSSFSEALRRVAVRVSGERDAAERITQAVPNARPYVQSLSVVKADGTIAVGFDRITIEQLLTKAALPIWGRERPAVLVWLRLGEGNWLNAGSTAPEREAMERAAQARGLPLVWPAMDAQDLATATSLVTAHSPEQLTASAARYRADAVLFGIAGVDSSGAQTAQFTFVYGDDFAEQLGSPEEGVHLAADRCAKLLATSAGVRSDITVRVTGIGNLDAYARTLNYLEALSVVRNVAVEQLQADVLDMRLNVRGDAGVLRRTIALDRRLVADNSFAADGAMGFRFAY